MARPTISDVAEKAGYSKATVSAVLNDADTVSESTRKKINRVIDELNYRPRAAAQKGFRGDDNKSIGLIIKEEGNPYYADVISGARDFTNQNGYTLVVGSSGGEYDSEQEIVDVFKSKDVDGLIIVPVLDSNTDLSYLFELKRRNFPFVLLEEIRGIQASLVDIENVSASKMAASYLIESGHRHIVHFAGPEYSMHSEERVRGVRKAFSESPLAFSDDLIVPTGAHLEDGYEVGISYFGDTDSEERPTAVICYNDLVAIGLMRALRELDISVPGDVSIIGCDDIEFAKYVSVPLTSIHIPKFEMGRRAAKILVQQIESDQKRAPQQEYLQAELVQRASTTAPMTANGTVSSG
jgi:DNA-binding LacI/PurR family transcriptional regulator